MWYLNLALEIKGHPNKVLKFKGQTDKVCLNNLYLNRYYGKKFDLNKTKFLPIPSFLNNEN